ncbi:hypothetical protein [Aureibacter tunicatorum]|uniref:Late embryogenesis abundant protein n=1 Tax=Aureibacter tunicatorum TaxID=866807 RepID=A0AAE3XPW9_9BACT|nr:hypothetical protein [Aureibacter tunicatorum]MDR6240962.1 hypothetical protein [Aureibacter tunicatorum]BDD03742.1 hypothetical protein AUTU_12250 [Aureibacter tunicatorum]
MKKALLLVSLLAFGPKLYSYARGMKQSAEKLQVNLHDIKRVRFDSGKLNFDVILEVHNNAEGTFNLDHVFAKILITDKNGDKMQIGFTPPNLRSALIRPFATTKLTVPFQVPLLSNMSNLFSVFKLKTINLEIEPTISGITLPVIHKSFSL